jgi:hypothetical protein
MLTCDGGRYMRRRNVQMKISPMLKHAIESFEHGLEHYLEGSDKSRKFCFLHVDQSIELFLKEKAMQTGKSIYKSDGTTLSIHETFNSLKGKIDMPEKPMLEDLHSLRNVIQHKGLVPDEELTQYHIENSYDFVKRFLIEELNVEFAAVISKKYVALMEGQKRISYDEVLALLYQAQTNNDPIQKILGTYMALQRAVQIRSDETGKPQKFRTMFKEMAKANDKNIKTVKSNIDEIMRLRGQILHSSYEPSQEEADSYYSQAWALLTSSGISKSFKKAESIKFMDGNNSI